MTSTMPAWWLAYGTYLTSQADLFLQSEERKLATLLWSIIARLSTPDRQVYVSLHGEESALGYQADQYANKSLDQISDDELSVNAPQDESQQDKESRR